MFDRRCCEYGYVIVGLLALGLVLGTAGGCGDGDGGDPDTGTSDQDTSETTDTGTAETGKADADATGCPEIEEIDSDVTEETTWGGEPGCLDYLLVDAIDVEAALTVEPGVRVEVEQGDFLDVQEGAAITAEGTEEEPIVFAGTEETAGFWRGISVQSQTNDNVFDYVEIRDAGGQWGGSSDSKTAVYLNRGHLTITNSTFRNNAHNALQVRDSEGSIEGFDNNTFVNNGTPMWLHQEHVGSLAGTSTFSGHETSAIQVTFFHLDELTSNATWKAFDIPYRLMTRTRIQADVTLEAGTTVEVTQNVRITVESGGSLNAEGTSDAPVTIRGAEAIAGHWKGLAFRTSSTDNQLTHTEVVHGGSQEWTGSVENNSKAAIFLGDSGTVDLDQATIKKSGHHGVYIFSGQIISCDGVTFEDIPGDDVRNTTGDESASCGL